MNGAGAYNRDRRSRSCGLGIIRDVIAGIMGAVFGWLVPPNVTSGESLLFAILGGVGGVVVLETATFVWRFVVARAGRNAR